eukprot:GFUD01042275.1.p1 GENE.GFUD01042275.1~~GFUD01042275.1.p1  ORF type:complete len:543 (+),score=121.27 GFUD01042275.1:118-1746(+)
MSNSSSQTGPVQLGEGDGFFQSLVQQCGRCEKGRGGENLGYCDKENFGSFMVNMGEDMYYPMDRRRVGTALIINNLDLEQTPTRKDVESMGSVLKDIGFDVEVHCNLSSQGMNVVKRKVTEESKHKDANCFLMLIISHGTADNFLLDKDGNKTWNIESLVTEVCDVQSLVGKPKLFFIEACRGKENNFSTQIMTKSSAPPQQSGITLPSKQDVFVGFATVPGFVSFTSMKGSPYLQALSSILTEHRDTTDLSDIHLLVKRRLAGMKLGADGARQGAEERSSLLSKLLFSRYSGNHNGKIKEESNSLMSRFSSLSSIPPGKQNSEGQSISIPINISDQKFEPDMSSLSLSSSRSTPTAEARSRYFSSLSTPSQTPFPMSVTNNKRPNSLIFSSGVSKPPRSAMYSSPMSSSYSSSKPILSNLDSPNSSIHSFSSQKPPMTLQLTPTPSIFTSQSSTNVHIIEIQSSDVEGGLKDLLNKVAEVYGGEGKVKIKKSKKKENSYSFKYIGPEKAALLLEKALNSVKELQSKSNLWKFTQRLEISVI